MFIVFHLSLTIMCANGTRSFVSGSIGRDPKNKTVYSGLSVLLPLRVRLGHLSWNNSGGSATAGIRVITITEESISHECQLFKNKICLETSVGSSGLER
jgi:hypothetical protein